MTPPQPQQASRFTSRPAAVPAARSLNGDRDYRVSGVDAVWRAKWYILAAAILAGLAIGAASYLIPATYKSSATVRVVAQSQAGVPSDQIVQASNDLASEYAQLGTSQPIVSAAASQLGMSTGDLQSKVSSGTVSGQNLVQISVQASSPGAAEKRTSAVASQFAAYVSGKNAQQAAQYAASVRAKLAPLDSAIAAARHDIATGGGNSATQIAKQSTLSDLLTQRQTALSQLATATAAGQPLVEVFAPAGPGSKVSPKPVLYGIIAFVVVALVAAQLSTVILSRRIRRAA
jgi:capsular polysaccharide biosynthesis protein